MTIQCVYSISTYYSYTRVRGVNVRYAFEIICVKNNIISYILSVIILYIIPFRIRRVETNFEFKTRRRILDHLDHVHLI